MGFYILSLEDCRLLVVIYFFRGYIERGFISRIGIINFILEVIKEVIMRDVSLKKRCFFFFRK